MWANNLPILEDFIDNAFKNIFYQAKNKKLINIIVSGAR